MKVKTFFTSNENAMYYECGFSCDNAILFKNNLELYFITDSRYTLEAKEATKHIKNIEIIESNDLIKDFIKIAKNIKNITFDPTSLSVESFNQISQKLSITPYPNFHQKIRAIKQDFEIELIKKSQKLNKKAFKKFAKFLRKECLNKDINEIFLNFNAKKILENKGKNNLSFNPITALNANAAKPHALPLKDKLKRGDLLLFDAGIKYKRYCSDMTRTSLVDENITFDKFAKFSNKIQKIYDIVIKAQETAIKNTRSGMKAKEVDALSRSIIEKAGYGKFFTHSTGHGVGLDIHELPRISTTSDMLIQDGMVFSIEPGIYLPNEFGVRIEDLVVIKDGKAEIL
ncbi:M24 family metallopeptidase [Helicobacter sp. MIT 14-3879]|uniref:M24 family metallopeptidase n=1 Tax=Helicobacter sp. MIT 14-3879 TaxID=2040649 RepID=UPI000E1F4A09|nr:M24 family metallopeptidase [Helicobacter sp. MIT 14-3879]RDU65175.1 X-Pro aminopeptidase [Helicobacter sp. MIT 14-3879]